MGAPGEELDLEPAAVEPVVGPILRKRTAADTSPSGTVAKLKKKPRGTAEPVTKRNLRKRASPEETVAAPKKKTR